MGNKENPEDHNRLEGVLVEGKVCPVGQVLQLWVEQGATSQASQGVPISFISLSRG